MRRGREDLLWGLLLATCFGGGSWGGCNSTEDTSTLSSDTDAEPGVEGGMEAGMDTDIGMDTSGGTDADTDSDSEPQGQSRLSWFKDAKFGLCLVWGLYSVPAGIKTDGTGFGGYAEWYQVKDTVDADTYAALADEFTAESFDPFDLVEKAGEAGFKYITVVAKFHDGFAMWPSEVSDFNITTTSFYDATGLDPLEELRDACDAHGLKLIYYYSHIKDWHQYNAWQGANAIEKNYYEFMFPDIWAAYPDGDFPDKDHDDYIYNVAIPQLEELCGDKYRPDGFWFDTPGQLDDIAYAEDITAAVRAGCPNCLINSRLAFKNVNSASRWDLIDYASFGDGGEGNLVDSPWYGESPAMGQVGTYSYHELRDWKGPMTMIGGLISAADNNYNILLSLPPTAAGAYDEIGEARLASLADWMAVNDSSIHGTRPVPTNYIMTEIDYQEGSGIQRPYMTTKENFVYLFFRGANTPDTIELQWANWASNPIVSAISLGTGPDGSDEGLPAPSMSNETFIVSTSGNVPDNNKWFVTVVEFESAVVSYPELNVLGNGVEIHDGGTASSSDNDTDFGAVVVGESADHVFTVNNGGEGDLVFTGSPLVEIFGDDAFSVTVDPANPVAPETGTTFTLTFAPTSAGARSATVFIANNDDDESPFTFEISGLGEVL